MYLKEKWTYLGHLIHACAAYDAICSQLLPPAAIYLIWVNALNIIAYIKWQSTDNTNYCEDSSIIHHCGGTRDGVWWAGMIVEQLNNL